MGAAYESSVQLETLDASADISASYACFIKLSSGQAAVCSTGQMAYGVLAGGEPTAAGKAAAVMTSPGRIALVKVGVGGVSAGSKVASDSTGRAVVVTSGSYILGEALAAGAVNEIIPVLFFPQGKL
jgi:hypothetical protein